MATEIVPCHSVIKSLSTVIIENSRNSGECLLFQADQNNSAHLKLKSVLLVLAKASAILNVFV